VTRERPWWASDGTVEGGLDTSEDPVERIRHARRGGGDDQAGRPSPRGGAPGAGWVGDPEDLPFTDEPGVGDAGGPGDGAAGGGRAGDPAGGGTDGPARDHDDDRVDDPTGGVGGGPDLPPSGPWWEAAAETVSRLARDLAETAEAHDPRADEGADAGRSHGTAREAPPTTGRGDPGAHGGEPGGRDGPAPADGQDTHRVDACGICPICVGLRALGESRPELVGHLAEAARHMALAARSLAARPGSGAPDDEPLQHIGLDD
jgi:hypothetical protein